MTEGHHLRVRTASVDRLVQTRRAIVGLPDPIGGAATIGRLRRQTIGVRATSSEDGGENTGGASAFPLIQGWDQAATGPNTGHQVIRIMSRMKTLCLAATVLALGVPDACRAQQPSASRKPIDMGFLFIDGKFTPPPYTFLEEGERVFVNGAALERRDLEQRPEDQARSRRHRSVNDTWRRLVRALESGRSVVLFAGHQPVMLDTGPAELDLLTALTNDDLRRRAARDIPRWLPDEADAEVWQRWFVEFVPSQEFTQRARAEIERTEAVLVGNKASNAAVRRSELMVYPLMVAGMLLVAISFGHLLTHRPPAVGSTKRGRVSPEITRAVRQSLILIAAISVLDLIWTLLVSRMSGQMREINPLGNWLIDSPVQLVIFKVVATSIGVGLLFALRQFPFARLATWWMCLVCTLLTLRWLTLSSLYVS
jgi:hypothetical protein